MSRVLVKYTKAHSPSADWAIGVERWLCLNTRMLYHTKSGGGLALPEYTFTPGNVVGQWVSDFADVVEVNCVAGTTPTRAILDEIASSTDPSQGFKADAGKPDFSLLTQGCPVAMLGVVEVLSFAVRPKEQGGKGYVKHSWRQVPDNKNRYESALHRHLNAINLGEELDSESGLSHWFHVACNAMFLAELYASDD